MTPKQEANNWHRAGYDVAEIAWMMQVAVHQVQEWLS